eukprot:CAMPEP_0197650254 /NCGR_PEP_ID=MMETSP1338-20131121/30832_1 /TAXON_ID=43686 ORGANISM="Pelagodinium beii, Strain RCC1491" /NCGR_SAMPLE_ID=MMETSP1338 /ASSEMBLY_ACC=CAM_ASM_000754 /LENGTH=143 /DNA_ID=CAMNT_0043224617 /DNA_START=81 /DNA_END=513 /DNA_ORIENTATION=-
MKSLPSQETTGRFGSVGLRLTWVTRLSSSSPQPWKRALGAMSFLVLGRLRLCSAAAFLRTSHSQLRRPTEEAVHIFCVLVKLLLDSGRPQKWLSFSSSSTQQHWTGAMFRAVYAISFDDDAGMVGGVNDERLLSAKRAGITHG